MGINTELSFCIPTYNNANSLLRLVADILKSNDPTLEVVVLDNGSSDNTLDLLNKIDDTRLSVYTNGVNKGALFNMINVLDKGRGAFLVYCTDHDHVDYRKIDSFKNFLFKEEGVSCGYCEYYSLNEKPDSITFNTGFDSISNLAYITRHPTGYFFNNILLKSISITRRFSNYDYVDLFPLEFVFAELCLLGKGAIFKDSVFTPETGSRVVEHKSATTNGNSKNAFFLPPSRLKMAVNFEDHIMTLNISKEDKKKLIINSFFRQLFSATIGYRALLANEALCAHYYIKSRKLVFFEIFSIAYNFYNVYSVRVIGSRFPNFVSRFSFKLSLLIAFLKKTAKFILKIDK